MEPKVLHLGVRGSTPSPPHWDWEASRSRFRRGSPSMQHRKMHKPWWSQCVKFATHNNDDSNDGLGHALVATLEICSNHTFCKVFEHLNRLMMLWSDWKSSEQGKRVLVDANGSQTLAISASLQEGHGGINPQPTQLTEEEHICHLIFDLRPFFISL